MVTPTAGAVALVRFPFSEPVKAKSRPGPGRLFWCTVNAGGQTGRQSGVLFVLRQFPAQAQLSSKTFGAFLSRRLPALRRMFFLRPFCAPKQKGGVRISTFAKMFTPPSSPRMGRLVTTYDIRAVRLCVHQVASSDDRYFRLAGYSIARLSAGVNQ